MEAQETKGWFILKVEIRFNILKELVMVLFGRFESRSVRKVRLVHWVLFLIVVTTAPIQAQLSKKTDASLESVLNASSRDSQYQEATKYRRLRKDPEEIRQEILAIRSQITRDRVPMLCVALRGFDRSHGFADKSIISLSKEIIASDKNKDNVFYAFSYLLSLSDRKTREIAYEIVKSRGYLNDPKSLFNAEIKRVRFQASARP
jgi:hypothetical protein